MLFQRIKIVFNWVIDPKINHVKTGAFKHHRNKVFANVMDITLDRANHHCTNSWCACFSKQRPQNTHARLHRIRCHQDFGNKQNTIAEINADNRHALDKRFGQNLIRCPTPLKQNIDTFNNLILHAVIKVVMHLLDKFIIVQIS